MRNWFIAAALAASPFLSSCSPDYDPRLVEFSMLKKTYTTNEFTIEDLKVFAVTESDTLEFSVNEDDIRSADALNKLLDENSKFKVSMTYLKINQGLTSPEVYDNKKRTLPASEFYFNN